MSLSQALPPPTPDSAARFRENLPFTGTKEDLVLHLRRDWETPRDLTRNELAGMINLDNYKHSGGTKQLKIVLHILFWPLLLITTDSLVTAIVFALFYYLIRSRMKRKRLSGVRPKKIPRRNAKQVPTSFNMLLVFLDTVYIPPRYRNYAAYLKARWQEYPIGFKNIMTMEELQWSIETEANPSGGVASYTSGSWGDTRSIYHGIVNEFTDYSMDILKILHKPLILDMSSSFTRDFHLSLNHAKQVEPLPDIAFDPNHPFIKLVGELKFNWDALLAEAEKVNLSNFSPEEAAGIERAKKMMALALDTSTTSAERQLAYRRAMKELEGLLLVPQTAILELEKTVGLRAIGGSS